MRILLLAWTALAHLLLGIHFSADLGVSDLDHLRHWCQTQTFEERVLFMIFCVVSIRLTGLLIVNRPLVERVLSQLH